MPLLPAPLGDLGRRRFSFYPAILGIEHNEWILGRATWTEVQVINAKSAEELFVPRRLVGEVSRAEGPVAIVGLLKELEYRQGVVLPHSRCVIEMPRAVNGSPRPITSIPAHPAPVVAIRAEPVGESRAKKLLRGSVAVGILACVAGGFLVRDLHVGTNAGVRNSPQRDLPLTAEDDYASVVRKLGLPASDRWLAAPSGDPYRRLWYPRRGVVVILAGTDPDSSHYVGALTFDGRIVHAAAPDVLEEITAAGGRR